MKSTSYMVCADCIHPIANGDFSGLDYFYFKEEANKRQEEIENGMARLANSHPDGNLTAGDSENNEEFARYPCQCCGSVLHGARYEVVVIHK